MNSGAIEAREIKQAQIPQGALGETAVAVGKKSIYVLTKGQIMSAHDLNPYPPEYMYLAVQAVKEIRAGVLSKPMQ